MELSWRNIDLHDSDIVKVFFYTYLVRLTQETQGALQFAMKELSLLQLRDRRAQPDGKRPDIPTVFPGEAC